MASLFPLGLQVGQSPGADPLELNVDKPILSRHVTRFRDRDEHILSGLLDGLAGAFDLNVNNITVNGTLIAAGQFEFPAQALAFVNLSSGIGLTGIGN